MRVCLFGCAVASWDALLNELRSTARLTHGNPGGGEALDRRVRFGRKPRHEVARPLTPRHAHDLSRPEGQEVRSASLGGRHAQRAGWRATDVSHELASAKWPR